MTIAALIPIRRRNSNGSIGGNRIELLRQNIWEFSVLIHTRETLSRGRVGRGLVVSVSRVSTWGWSNDAVRVGAVWAFLTPDSFGGTRASAFIHSSRKKERTQIESDRASKTVL
jgi:hypothetical protein